MVNPDQSACLEPLVQWERVDLLDHLDSRAFQGSLVIQEVLERQVSLATSVRVVLRERQVRLVQLGRLDHKVELDRLDSLELLVIKAALASLDSKDQVDSEDSPDHRVDIDFSFRMLNMML